MIRKSLPVVAGFAAVALASAAAQAVPGFGNVSPTKSPSGAFIPGSGIPADNFTTDTALSGESVALKARDRNTGEALLVVGNHYLVSAGADPSNAARAAWNFDFQFSPGVAGNPNPAAYTYQIEADTNPALGVANFVTLSVPSSVAAAPMGDSYYPNGTGGNIGGTIASPTYSYTGAWSDATPYVIANSQNYTFAHFAGPSFTNAGPAEYEIRFTAFSGATPVATTTIYADVVPEPASLGLIGIGASALLLRRGRRNARPASAH
jgi:hypothetical protein